MAKDKIVILGAGLAGLSAAYHLEKRGLDYSIFEKEKSPGGLCRSNKIDGHIFDYAGHLLHFRNKYTRSLVKDLLGKKLAKHKRRAWIYSYNSFTHYPFQANLYGLPINVVNDCLLGFIKASDGLPKKDNPTFGEWITQTFGEGIAKHFMLPYNTKFWRAPLDKLTCDWVNDFIPVPNMKEVIAGTLKESKLKFGYNSFFWYPCKGGIQELVSALSKKIKKVSTVHNVIKVDLIKKQVYFSNGKKKSYDRLISTLPLVELVKLTEGVPVPVLNAAKQLKWISVFNLNLSIDRSNISDRHWVYFPEKEYIFYRVGFPNNFYKSSKVEQKSSLYVEVSYDSSSKQDKKRLSARIIKDLAKAKVISKKDKIVALDIKDIKYAYPIYDLNYQRSKQLITGFFNQKGIILSGRYGSWSYMSMEDVLLEGRDIVKKLTGAYKPCLR